VEAPRQRQHFSGCGDRTRSVRNKKRVTALVPLLRSTQRIMQTRSGMPLDRECIGQFPKASAGAGLCPWSNRERRGATVCRVVATFVATWGGIGGALYSWRAGHERY
jgi:hypothetical protein